MIRKSRLEQIRRVMQGSVMTNRSASTRQNRMVEEIRIPVPWGHIAGKWWGNRNREPVIALHGWQDNAGTWDPFARALPPSVDFSWLALDFPGHGRSSYLPPGFESAILNTLTSLRLVQTHLALSTVHLAGHSLGSIICSRYASAYPEAVASYFGVDAVLRPHTRDVGRTVDIWAKAIDKLVDMHGSGLKVYKRDEALKRYCQAAPSISRSSAEILFERGIVDLGDGNVSFIADPRVKMLAYQSMHLDFVTSILKGVRCHVCIIKGRESKIMDASMKAPEILEALKSNAKSYTFKELPGDHHLHMDNPEMIVQNYLEFRESIK